MSGRSWRRSRGRPGSAPRRTGAVRAAPYPGGVLPAPAVPAGAELPLDTPHITAPRRALGSVRRP
ncbi:hypothetical protein ACIOGX_03035 [Streptomyces sp. NPDC088147]|uniref:hypothetical protein n=1 Tax=Streptomyces sp. NPDC088147 TaxID=3365830 RepID=UPI0037FFD008